MRAGHIVEIIAVIVLVASNLILISLILVGILEEIPPLVGLVMSSIATVSSYIIGRFMAFRHNIGNIELLAIDLLVKMKEEYGAPPSSNKFILNLESDIGPRSAKLIYENLTKRKIIHCKNIIEKNGPPKLVEVVDTAWRAYLI